MNRITLVPGDGIGPEVMFSAKKIIDASGAGIDWDIEYIDYEELLKNNSSLPKNVVSSIEKNKIALKGPTTTKVGEGLKSINVSLRQHFNLYANLRPIRSFEGIDSIHKYVDLVIVRENTEGLYAGIEHRIGEHACESIKLITKDASSKIARFGYEFAASNGRKLATIAHKANIMKLSDGLFLNTCREVSRDFDHIDTNDCIIDALCMKLVQNPKEFDVIIAPNLYGDILSDLCAGLVGGLGMAPGANIGDEFAIFESVHGSAPDIAGKNIANPVSAILSGILMLRHMKKYAEADKIENALLKAFKDKSKLTADLGGSLSTSEFTDHIIGLMDDY